jgi:hypothetical protein
MNARAVVLAPVAALLAAAVMTFPAVSVASQQTTQPTRYLTVVAVFTDKNLRVAVSSNLSHGSVAVGSNIPRGDYLNFRILNRGKRLHNFTIFGMKTKPIKPGGKAHLAGAATFRGTYEYGSTLDKGKAFHGFLTVV